MLRSSKRKFVSEHLNKDQNTKQWWETLNQLTHKTSNQNNNNRLLIDGEFLTTQDFTNNINDYYLTVGGEAIPQNDLEIRSLHDSHPLDLLSIGEVKRLIRKLDTTKSTSSEDFPTWLSKECCEDLCIPIHDIINCMLSTIILLYGNKLEWRQNQRSRTLPNINILVRLEMIAVIRFLVG